MRDAAAQIITPSDAELRRRTSIKWSRSKPGYLAADIAELDFDVAPPVRRAVDVAVRRSDFGYPDFVGGSPVRLKEVFAARMSARHGWEPDPARVEVCTQIMQALCCAVLAFTRAGDTVLAHAPTYPPIRHAVEALGRRLATIPVADLQDAGQLRAAVSKHRVAGRVSLIVWCQPHNPTGHVFDARTLEALAAYATEVDAVVFADEIYQDLVYGDTAAIAPAAVAGLARRTVSFTSAAKSFNIPGLRCAVGHFGSPELHAAFCMLPWHLRDGASLLGVNATLAAWEHGEAWLESLVWQLTLNRSMVGDALGSLPGVRYTVPDATYLAWLDLRESPAAADPRGFFEGQAKVLVQAGGAFGAEFEGFARLNFGTSPGRLRTILDRIVDALKG